MSFSNFNVLPDDRQTTPEQDLEAAVAGALALPGGVTPVSDPVPVPFGKTWQFDWENGRFIYAGSSPAETRHFGAVAEWCLMAVHAARFAHSVFSDQFGMEAPSEPLGEFADGEILADWQRHFVEALLVHERITSIENIDLTWDPSAGVLYLNSFDVVTDEEERITITDVAVTAQRSSL